MLDIELQRYYAALGIPMFQGYGLSEASPVISSNTPGRYRFGSSGILVKPIDLKVCDEEGQELPQGQKGELWIKGGNVMAGYWRNEKSTAETIVDGWLHTGDICNVDSDGFIYIRGRNKNMILGPSGQNIYPEEIEQKLNNLPYVNESIVIERDGKIIALVHPDYDLAQSQGLTDDDIKKQMDDNIAALNKEIPAYSQVAAVEIHEEEFEKTPKRSIRRFLYK